MEKEFRKDVNYYQLLQVDPEADPLVIKNAYYTILNQLCTHPDKGGDEEKTKLINEAYHILSSRDLRKAYDRFLQESGRRQSSVFPLPDENKVQVIRYQERTSRDKRHAKHDIFSISDTVDRFFQSFFGEEDEPYDKQSWYPPVNIYTEAGNLVIEMEVPGVTWDDIHIEFKESVVTVWGEKRQENKNYLRVEFHSGPFSHSFRLPRDVEPEKMTASLRDGILELVIPGSTVKKARTIPITQL